MERGFGVRNEWLGGGRVTITWFIIRGSGLVAYAMLALATIWGLLLSTKVLGRAAKAKPLSWFHESLGLAAVLATAVHMGALVADNYMEFGVKELLVPGASTFAPLGVALGVMALYGAVIVSGSFYIKEWIGQSAWRAIHFLSFGSFAASTAHGVMVGTDSGGALGLALYLAPSVVVVLLLIVRIALVSAPETSTGRVRVPPRAEAVPAVAE
jgi:hypothetical protein